MKEQAYKTQAQEHKGSETPDQWFIFIVDKPIKQSQNDENINRPIQKYQEKKQNERKIQIQDKKWLQLYIKHLERVANNHKEK